MKYQHRVLGMLSLLAVITYLDRICILFQQPTLCALCLDVGRKHAGAVFGFMHTAANAASALSAVLFGYIVSSFGTYTAPFVPMVALLSVGAALWLQVDATCDLFQEERPAEATQVAFR